MCIIKFSVEHKISGYLLTRINENIKICIQIKINN